MISLEPNKGRLLIAEPTLTGDISFNRAVVLLADHMPQGSVGFILNKVLEFTLNDLVPGMPENFKIYNGGPVEQDNLYFIHQLPDLIPGSIEIADGIYWGGDFEVVKAQIEQGHITEKEIKFFLGYSGWDNTQLKEEVESSAWIIIDNEDEKKLIEQLSPNLWNDKIKALGGHYLIWANAPEFPSYN